MFEKMLKEAKVNEHKINYSILAGRVIHNENATRKEVEQIGRKENKIQRIMLYANVCKSC